MCARKAKNARAKESRKGSWTRFTEWERRLESLMFWKHEWNSVQASYRNN